MRRLVWIWAAAWLAGISLFGDALPVKDFRSLAVVRTDDPVHRFAAEELALHWKMATGRSLSSTPERAPALVIGAPPGVETLPTEAGAAYRRSGNVIYFYGDDSYDRSRPLEKILADRNSRTGTLSAVYLFFEREFGVVWPQPGNSHTTVARRPEWLTLADSETVIWRPAMEFSFVRGYYWNSKRIAAANRNTPPALRLSPEKVAAEQQNHLIWLRRMRLQSRSAIFYGHAFIDWQKRFLATHPEYLGLNADGTRGLPAAQADRVKLCVSNPAVADQIVRDWLDAGKPKYWNICPNDGTPGFCRCENCMRLDARRDGERFLDHLTDRYVWFWNSLAEKMRAHRPDVRLITYAYSYYRFPPRREKVKYPDNLLFGLVPMLLEDNEAIRNGWIDAGARHFFLRPNDLCYEVTLFRGLERSVFDGLRSISGGELVGVDFDGCIGNPPLLFDFYVAARASVRPEMSFEQIEAEYLSAYGSAAPEVRAFFSYYREEGAGILHKVYDRLRREKRYLLDAGQVPLVVQQDIGFYYSEEMFQKGAELLDKALAQPDLSVAERERLELLQLHHRHARESFRFVREVNLMRRGLENRARLQADVLLKFREQHRERLNNCWPLLFAGKRGEAQCWKSIQSTGAATASEQNKEKIDE